MALSAIELLPPEIIEIIAQDLTLEELNACCATSKRMRYLFDINLVWKKYCNQELDEYLKQTPCKVQPYFLNPNHNSSTLRPISQRRLAFIRENHLWRNWRHGRYKEEEVTDENISFMACYKFLTNDWGIALFGTKIKLIDISKLPPTSIEIDIPPQSSCSWQVCGGNDMIVLQSLRTSHVQVYYMNIAATECSLVHEFFFEKSEKESTHTEEEIKPKFELYKKLKPSQVTTVDCQGCFANTAFTTQRTIVGTFFIGVAEGESTMHIWDIETGVKLKEEICPLEHSAVYSIKASDSLDLILAVKQTGKIATSFLAYSLKSLAYLSFNKVFQHAGNYIVHQDMVVIYNELLYLYNYKTSEEVLVGQPFECYPQILNNCIVFIQNGKMKRLKPTTVQLEIVLDGVSSFTVLSGRYLEVERDNKHEIWEISMNFGKLRKTSMSLDYDPWVYFNATSTRCILRNSTGLFFLHFW